MKLFYFPHLTRTAVMAALLVLQAEAKKKNEVDPQEIRRLNAELSALKKENQKLDNDLAKVDSLASEETSRTQILHQNFEKEIERKKAEIDELKGKLADFQKKINQEKSTQAGYRNQMEELDSRLKANTKLVLDWMAEVETWIQDSPPWNLDSRLERVRVLRRDLESQNASLEEAYVRLESILKEEIKYGDEIILTNEPVTLATGELLNARILKIGNQWMVYMDEEEKRFGILVRTRKGEKVEYSWKEDLSFEEREAVRKAMDIKSGKKPPGLVSLPLSLTLESAAKEGN